MFYFGWEASWLRQGFSLGVVYYVLANIFYTLGTI